MLEENIDTVVLGCTHYPFVIPLIQQIVGESVRVINPAPAVAKQVRRVLEGQEMRKRSNEPGELRFYTSGDPDEFRSLLPVLLEEEGRVQKVKWMGDTALAVEKE
jgi:glutamate racemase